MRSGIFNRARLERAIEALIQGEALDSTYHDHALTGDMAGYRECHITGDLLLVYKVDVTWGEIVFVSLGNHANQFG